MAARNAFNSCISQQGDHSGCQNSSDEAYARTEEAIAKEARKGNAQALKKQVDWVAVAAFGDQLKNPASELSKYIKEKNIDVATLSPDQIKSYVYQTAIPDAQKTPCADQACTSGDIARQTCALSNAKYGLNQNC